MFVKLGNKLHILYWYLKALKETPEGKYCAYCKELNDNWDDCGFWFQYPKEYSPFYDINGISYLKEGYEKEFKFACSKCFRWEEYIGER